MAANFTINIDAGSDYFLSMRMKDENGEYVDFTNLAARMKLRDQYNSSDIKVSLTSDIGGGMTFEQSDDGDYIDTLSIHLTNIQTASLVSYLPADAKKDTTDAEGVYDIELVWPDGVVRRIFEGAWIATPESTR